MMILKFFIVKKLALKFIMLSGFILCSVVYGGARVKLPTLISDGMVLQREQNITIWGSADPNEEIKISFLEKNYQVMAGSDGSWKIIFPPMKPGGPFIMVINDIEIKDILIGDVWLCSGQSNMELPISRVTDLYRKETESYTNPMIRHIKVPLSYNFHHSQTDIQPAEWKRLTPENAMSFSALAYFFAKELFEKNKIPVGLINSAVGGSPVEAWISEEGLKLFPEYFNEKKIYESDSYIENTRKMERQRRNLWNAVLYEQDAGLNTSIKWYLPEYDDYSWEITTLFDLSWGNNGLNPINGSFWFRKEFDLSAILAEKNAILRLGCIVDADSVFINGNFVGTTAYQYPPRIYPIPSKVLKEGKNLITVRLISYNGYPRFVEEKPYKIIFNNQEVNLEGEWRYRQGVIMPSLPGETFFQYKPAGLYNAMIAPLQNYAIKGAVWYQGEANTSRYNEYYDLLKTMIDDWRKLWNRPDLPFVVCELAGFGRPTDTSMQRQWSAFRAEQRRVALDTPNTGIARAEDLGEWNDIHPLNKKELGIRVAVEIEKLTK